MAFYRDVVGLPLALEVPERGAAFFWIGGPGEAMLGLWSLGSAPMGLSLHVAFKASLEDVLGACDRLRVASASRRCSFFAHETTEPSVIGWMPAAAVVLPRPGRAPARVPDDADEPPRARRRDRRAGHSGPQATARPDRSRRVRVERHTGPARRTARLFERPRTPRHSWTPTWTREQVLVATRGRRVVGTPARALVQHRRRAAQRD